MKNINDCVYDFFYGYAYMNLTATLFSQLKTSLNSFMLCI